VSHGKLVFRRPTGDAFLDSRKALGEVLSTPGENTDGISHVTDGNIRVLMEPL
jgi:hypothetical protein